MVKNKSVDGHVPAGKSPSAGTKAKHDENAKNGSGNVREYRSLASSRRSSMKSYMAKRESKMSARIEYAVLEANARLICSDPVLREAFRIAVRDRKNERQRKITAGEIKITAASIRKTRAIAGGSMRLPSEACIANIRMAREKSRNFAEAVAGYGTSENDLIPHAEPTVSIPKGPGGVKRLVASVCSDEAQFAAVAKELRRLAKVENEGLSKEQIKAKSIDQTKLHMRKKTTTEHAKTVWRRTIRIAGEKAKKYFEYGGERHCIREWARILGISYTGMRNRLRLYTPEVALSPDFQELYKRGVICHKGDTVPSVKLTIRKPKAKRP